MHDLSQAPKCRRPGRFSDAGGGTRQSVVVERSYRLPGPFLSGPLHPSNGRVESSQSSLVPAPQRVVEVLEKARDGEEVVLVNPSCADPKEDALVQKRLLEPSQKSEIRLKEEVESESRRGHVHE